jgi:hypothetical protein
LRSRVNIEVWWARATIFLLAALLVDFFANSFLKVIHGEERGSWGMIIVSAVAVSFVNAMLATVLTAARPISARLRRRSVSVR